MRYTEHKSNEAQPDSFVPLRDATVPTLNLGQSDFRATPVAYRQWRYVCRFAGYSGRGRARTRRQRNFNSGRVKAAGSEGFLPGDEVKRYTVASFSSNNAVEVYAIRRRLEPLAGSLAAIRATDMELTQIGGLFKEVELAAEKGDASVYVQLNRRFHMAIQFMRRAGAAAL